VPIAGTWGELTVVWPHALLTHMANVNPATIEMSKRFSGFCL